MAAYVYLLVHSREPRFKIGKSADVLARARALGITNFALERSLVLKVPNELRALQVEQALHRLFDPWRVPKSHLRGEAAVPKKGYTEWFRLSVLKRMQAFVESSLDVLKGELTPLPNVNTLITGKRRTQHLRARAATRRCRPSGTGAQANRSRARGR